jgi:hypothetical protein
VPIGSFLSLITDIPFAPESGYALLEARQALSEPSGCAIREIHIERHACLAKCPRDAIKPQPTVSPPACGQHYSPAGQ